MSLRVQKPGILTTIQDLGRTGYRQFGVNPGGAMDIAAARIINILLDNDECLATIEMHFPAPQFLFEKTAICAIGGADFGPELDGREIENWRPFLATKGSTLKFTGKNFGHRAYLALRGGFRIEKWLGSAGTNLAAHIGGAGGRKLTAGDSIRFARQARQQVNFYASGAASSVLPFYSRFPTVRFIPGAEFASVRKRSRSLLTKQNFYISNNSNRMGFRLSAEPIISSRRTEIVSSAVTFGTIQLLPDGQLIVLMADHQTTGGYPRIGHVISRDLPLIAQLGPGDKVAFHQIDQLEAERLALEFERELSFFRVGCRFQALEWN
ncbi:MAG TPA: biotin-dependent carboxyltransferase family protein [Pyrinomonadaceae bacterium]|nr:biotin-dependent carboxyltransferase family protein [Pyrinomonadaceae bacterium]